jgi:hypothetical protein
MYKQGHKNKNVTENYQNYISELLFKNMPLDHKIRLRK